MLRSFPIGADHLIKKSDFKLLYLTEQKKSS